MSASFRFHFWDRNENLNHLRCPECHSPMGMDRTSSLGGLESRILRCRCSRYPVLGGILTIEPSTKDTVLSLIDSQDASGLFEYLLTRCVSREVALGQLPTFFDALTDIGRLTASLPPERSMDDWVLHLRHWYRTPKYLACVPLAQHVTAARPRMVLDLGTGGGHAAYTLCRGLRPGAKIFAMDAVLSHLFIARWMLNGAGSVCFIHGDVTKPLPFVDGLFDCIISADSMHYWGDRQTALREVKRVRANDSNIVFTHIHNSLSKEEPSQGNSQSPDAWISLIEGTLGAPITALSDERLRQDLLRGAVNISASHSRAELRVTRSLTFVSGTRLLGTGTIEGGLGASVSDAILNPIYEPSRRGDRTISLTRSRLSEFFEFEFEYPEPPLQFELEPDRLGDERYRDMLRRRGIAIDAPERMCLAPTLSEWMQK